MTCMCILQNYMKTFKVENYDHANPQIKKITVQKFALRHIYLNFFISPLY